MPKERKPTAFEADVYRVTSLIPAGRVASYGWIVRQLGRGSPRAVGGALRENPYAPQVPCHRVIGSDGRIGGFMGNRTGETITRKLAMLEREGVHFSPAGKLMEPERMIDAYPPCATR